MKKLIIRSRSKFPKCIRHFKELQGICVGGCIDRAWNNAGEAHAHAYVSCSHNGWICLRYKYQLKEKNTLLHEVAHLIANRNFKTPPHGKEWRNVVMSIGGTFKSYWNYNKTFEYADFSPRKRKLS